MPNANFAVSNL